MDASSQIGLLVFATLIAISKQCNVVSMKFAENESLDGMYEYYSAGCNSFYDIFKSPNSQLFMYHTDDYWVVNGSYSCSFFNNDDAYARVWDNAYHPDDIDHVWEERSKSGIWNENHGLDVDCSEDCDVINLWHATDDSANGVYQRMPTECNPNYDAFKHENQELYMYHTDDYWVVNSQYSCVAYDKSNAELKVLDGAYHPAEIENSWQEKDTSGTWKTNHAIDVACSAECSEVLMERASDSFLNGVYEQHSVTCNTRYFSFKHQHMSMYLYHVSSFWLVNTAITCDGLDIDQTFLKIEGSKTHPADELDDWSERTGQQCSWQENVNIFVTCKYRDCGVVSVNNTSERFLNGIYYANSGFCDPGNSSFKHEDISMYLYQVGHYWIVASSIICNVNDDLSYLKVYDNATNPANIKHPWTERTRRDCVWAVNKNVVLNCEEDSSDVFGLTAQRYVIYICILVGVSAIKSII